MPGAKAARLKYCTDDRLTLLSHSFAESHAGSRADLFAAITIILHKMYSELFTSGIHLISITLRQNPHIAWVQTL